MQLSGALPTMVSIYSNFEMSFTYVEGCAAVSSEVICGRQSFRAARRGHDESSDIPR